MACFNVACVGLAGDSFGNVFTVFFATNPFALPASITPAISQMHQPAQSRKVAGAAGQSEPQFWTAAAHGVAPQGTSFGLRGAASTMPTRNCNGGAASLCWVFHCLAWVQHLMQSGSVIPLQVSIVVCSSCHTTLTLATSFPVSASVATHDQICRWQTSAWDGWHLRGKQTFS